MERRGERRRRERAPHLRCQNERQGYHFRGWLQVTGLQGSFWGPLEGLNHALEGLNHALEGLNRTLQGLNRTLARVYPLGGEGEPANLELRGGFASTERARRFHLVPRRFHLVPVSPPGGEHMDLFSCPLGILSSEAVWPRQNARAVFIWSRRRFHLVPVSPPSRGPMSRPVGDGEFRAQSPFRLDRTRAPFSFGPAPFSFGPTNPCIVRALEEKGG